MLYLYTTKTRRLFNLVHIPLSMTLTLLWLQVIRVYGQVITSGTLFAFLPPNLYHGLIRSKGVLKGLSTRDHVLFEGKYRKIKNTAQSAADSNFRDSFCFDVNDLHSW